MKIIFFLGAIISSLFIQAQIDTTSMKKDTTLVKKNTNAIKKDTISLKNDNINFKKDSLFLKWTGGIILGKTIATFSFIDSENAKESDLKSISGNLYGFNINYLLNEKNLLRSELVMYDAGAKKNSEGIYLEWNLKYAGIGAGYQYNILKIKNTKVNIGAMFRADYLLRAEQTIGSERFNLIEANALKKIEINANANAILSFKLAEFANLNLEYRYGMGLNQIEQDPTLTTQKTRNKMQALLLGIGFSF